MSRALLSLLLLVATSFAAADEGTGLKTSVSVDLVGAFRATDGTEAKDRFDVREAELVLYGPIDHLFDGVLSLAAHREKGVSLVEVHEAYVETSKLVPRTSVKLGQHFLGVGRLNRMHRHEWPFVVAPRVHERFFGAEGLLDTGLEGTVIAPTPFVLELTAGVANGWVYGHAHDEGEKPRQPTHYARLATFASLFGGGAQLGASGLSRTAASGERMTLVGGDLAYKLREGKVLTLLVQSEAWLRRRAPRVGRVEETFGAYLLPQWAVTEQVAFGVLADYYTILSLEDALGNRVANDEWGVTPTITWQASEFSRLRLGYERRKDQHTILVQAAYTMGAHPAHEF